MEHEDLVFKTRDAFNALDAKRRQEILEADGPVILDEMEEITLPTRDAFDTLSKELKEEIKNKGGPVIEDEVREKVEEIMWGPGYYDDESKEEGDK